MENNIICKICIYSLGRKRRKNENEYESFIHWFFAEMAAKSEAQPGQAGTQILNPSSGSCLGVSAGNWTGS